jgi:hypothetical protein
MNTRHEVQQHPSVVGPVFVGLFLLTGYAQPRAGSSNSICVSVYQDARRVNELVVSNKAWSRGSVASPAATRSASLTGLMTEHVAQAVDDCSDAKYQCVHSWNHTLAIPRNGLTPALKYQKANVFFVVEECLRILDGRCSISLVSARCPKLEPDGTCRSDGGKGRSTRFENIDYFVYNVDFGITAIGSTEKVAQTPEDGLRVATQFVLVSSIGIFFERDC